MFMFYAYMCVYTQMYVHIFVKDRLFSVSISQTLHHYRFKKILYLGLGASAQSIYWL